MVWGKTCFFFSIYIELLNDWVMTYLVALVHTVFSFAAAFSFFLFEILGFACSTSTIERPSV